jgi:hypothetical protein
MAKAQMMFEKNRVHMLLFFLSGVSCTKAITPKGVVVKNALNCIAIPP